MFRNLPNVLTLLRLFLVPFIVRAIWSGNYRNSLMLVAVAGATDALDGFLARRYDWTSQFGAYMDPIGDKALLVSIYIALGLQGAVPRWLTWLVLGRDFLILAMVASAFLFTAVRSFPPSVWGKLSTIVQAGGALFILFANAYPAGHSRLSNDIVIGCIAAVTLWSGVHYIWVGARRLRSLSQSPSY